MNGVRSAWMALGLAAATATGCASTQGPTTLASVRVIAPGRPETDLHRLKGKPTLVVACAGWANACLRQAAVLNQTAPRFAQLRVVTVLLDTVGDAAVAGYLTATNTRHAVVLATEPTRAGDTALGDLRVIPVLTGFNAAGERTCRHVGELDQAAMDAWIAGCRF